MSRSNASERQVLTKVNISLASSGLPIIDGHEQEFYLQNGNVGLRAGSDGRLYSTFHNSISPSSISLGLRRTGEDITDVTSRPIFDLTFNGAMGTLRLHAPFNHPEKPPVHTGRSYDMSICDYLYNPRLANKIEADIWEDTMANWRISAKWSSPLREAGYSMLHFLNGRPQVTTTPLNSSENYGTEVCTKTNTWLILLPHNFASCIIDSFTRPDYSYVSPIDWENTHVSADNMIRTLLAKFGNDQSFIAMSLSTEYINHYWAINKEPITWKLLTSTQNNISCSGMLS